MPALTAPFPPRWANRSDRLDLECWLATPRRGYRLRVDKASGAVVLMLDRWRIPVYAHWLRVDRSEVELYRSEWRSLMARRLRELRRDFRAAVGAR